MVNNNNTNDIFSRSGWRLIAVLLFFSFALTTTAQDKGEYSLNPSTDRCVALRQGQTCYKSITIEWGAPENGDYCLHNLQNNAVVQCWRQQRENKVKVTFESDRDITYGLRRENESADLATVTITVSWVYEPKPESSDGWRLF